MALAEAWLPVRDRERITYRPGNWQCDATMVRHFPSLIRAYSLWSSSQNEQPWVILNCPGRPPGSAGVAVEV